MKSELENATNSQRTALMSKAMSALILMLVPGPMEPTSAIIDDDEKTTMDLWDALSSLYTSCNEHTVINLIQES